MRMFLFHTRFACYAELRRSTSRDRPAFVKILGSFLNHHQDWPSDGSARQDILEANQHFRIGNSPAEDSTRDNMEIERFIVKKRWSLSVGYSRFFH